MFIDPLFKDPFYKLASEQLRKFSILPFYKYFHSFITYIDTVMFEYLHIKYFCSCVFLLQLAMERTPSVKAAQCAPETTAV